MDDLPAHHSGAVDSDGGGTWVQGIRYRGVCLADGCFSGWRCRTPSIDEPSLWLFELFPSCSYPISSTVSNTHQLSLISTALRVPLA